MAKNKFFKDPVHGYIEIPDSYCSRIIDTPIFQRLRCIEQTSMRPLYPAAHHDRFIHSLGVFHLGRKVFEAIKQNSDWQFIDEEDVTRLKNSFLLACLLHDCAHAPFSHTFEDYYELPVDESSGKGRAQNELEELVSDEFNTDLVTVKPQQHELASASIAISQYTTAIEHHQGSPELVARMIVGCKHKKQVPGNTVLKFENCFIELLNGAPVDVDKLDYILRDTWASGVKNVSIDVDRLLNAIFVDFRDDGVQLGFKQSALSVIQSVVDGRNFLYQWVYSHHTVLYYNELLTRASKKLAELLAENGDQNTFWKHFVSTETLRVPVKVKEHVFYLPSDGDLFHLLKYYSGNISETIELFSHSPQRFPLWKTKAQFDEIFRAMNATPADRDFIGGSAVEYLTKEFSDSEAGFMMIKAQAKIRSIDEQEIQILIDGNFISFDQIFPSRQNINQRYFYIFAPLELRDKRNDIIKALRDCKP